jgi:hypothetical protein
MREVRRQGGGRESAGVREGIYMGCHTAGDAVRGAVVPFLVCLVLRVRLARAFVCARRRVGGGLVGGHARVGSAAPTRGAHGRARHPCALVATACV